jgi:hypothetical protein
MASAALRVYSETLPWGELLRPRTLALLSRYELELVLAVRPWDKEHLPDVARALRDVGVPLSIWPMLADEDGRWASVGNAGAFRRFVLAVCDVLGDAGVPPQDVLYDLEPPIAAAQLLASLGAPDRGVRLDSGLGGSHRQAFAEACEVLAGSVAELHARGLSTSIAAWPLVALDGPNESGWQSLLGTPVDALGVGHVSVMMYTSMLEGWSRRTLRRRDVTALLAAATRRTIDRWGELAGMSLGCVGTGAFANEPVYRDPGELAEDAAIARAAGCERLSLFDLGGVIARPPAEGWLEAFTERAKLDPSHPLPGLRVRAARIAARGATWLVGRPRPSARLCWRARRRG